MDKFDTLKRYFSETPISVGGNTVIEGEQFRHMDRVMRHSVGDEIVLFFGDGKDYLCKIVSADNKAFTIAVLDARINPNSLSSIELNIFSGALKGDANITSLTMLSELNVTSFGLFTSQRTISKGANYQRLVKSAIESAKQCKRSVPLRLYDVTGFASALKLMDNCDIKLIAYENERDNSLKSILEKHRKSRHDFANISKKITIAAFTGPEGGFSAQEIETAVSYGFTTVSLGKTILRAETAAVSLASAIMCQMGEWD